MKTSTISKVGQTLNDTQIDTLIASVADTFAVTDAFHDRLKQSPVARLITALPFLAGCDHPERTALSHLAIYFMALGRSKTAEAIFDHNANDDGHIYARLEAISHFEGGDRAIIDRGMAILALSMVGGYKRDCAKDLLSGAYNPVLAGVWDADKIIHELNDRVLSVGCPPMDKILSKVDAPQGTWL